jgi:DNA-binding transcriptional regulator YiaG
MEVGEWARGSWRRHTTRWKPTGNTGCSASRTTWQRTKLNARPSTARADAITEENGMARVRFTQATLRAIRGDETQADFARLVGVSGGQVICRWECGHSQPHRAYLPALERLAKLRGVKLEVAGA